MALDRGLRVVAIIGVAALGVCGAALPGSLLVGGVAWVGFLLAVLAGWGFLVGMVLRTGARDVGQGAAWGVAGYLAVAGPLIAVGVFSAPLIYAALALGFAGFAWHELTAPRPALRALEDAVRFARARPGLTALISVLAAVALIQLVGAVAALDRNQYDDDIIYTPMIRRLLDAGDLIEPYSFRRLGAYGGQTALGALAAVRGTLANVHLIDHAVMFAIALLALVGYARARAGDALWTVLAMLIVLLIPETAVNAAAHWSGVAMFVVLYRAVADEDWRIAGLVAAATCTLRQNFVAIVVLFVGFALVARLLSARRERGDLRAVWRDERDAWRDIVVVAVLALAGWLIAAFVSSRTFLFPMWGGTWNAALSFHAPDTTWSDSVGYVLWACIDSTPIMVVPVLFAALAVTPDPRPGQPLRALLVASALAFLLLAQSLVGAGDVSNVWRYAFGFSVALTALTAIEVGANDARVPFAPLARWVVLAALVLQLFATRSAVLKRFTTIVADVGEARAIGRHGDPTATRERARYAAMQAALPAGAPVAVLLDDPAYLDFARNPIAILDTPGFASPDASWPAFAGAEPIRAYLVEHGKRYLAFVREDHSRYYYRRGYWLHRLFHDGGLFFVMSAYQLDAIDAFAELANTTHVMFDQDGLVVLDLGSPIRAASTRPRTGDEPTRRAAYVRELAEREGLLLAWSLTSREDLQFLDGVAPLQFIANRGADEDADEPSQDPYAPMRGTPIRALYRRAHLRVRGDTSMHLVLRAAVDLETTFTHPRLDVSLDGELVGSGVADAGGRYVIDVVVPADRVAGGWHDLYLVFSSIVEPSRDVRELRTSRLEAVEWTPAR
jgi:hypothetical protein